MKYWTMGEIAFLKENAGGMSVKEIAQKFNCDVRCVQNVAYRHKISLKGYKQNRQYALYKGDELLATGTIAEIAERMSAKESTIRFYGWPCAKKGKNRRILIELD